MIKKLAIILILVWAACSLGGCSVPTEYTGSVLDFATKEPIANARLCIGADTFIYTDETGHFGFMETPGFLTDSLALSLKSVRAAGYGTLYDVKIDPDTENLIALAPPRSVYGMVTMEHPENYKLAIEEEAYQAVTYPNERGEFCFSNVPVHEALSVFIYAGEQKSTFFYVVLLEEDHESAVCNFDGQSVKF